MRLFFENKSSISCPLVLYFHDFLVILQHFHIFFNALMWHVFARTHALFVAQCKSSFIVLFRITQNVCVVKYAQAFRALILILSLFAMFVLQSVMMQISCVAPTTFDLLHKNIFFSLFVSDGQLC